jgi:hypothetical protein
MKTLEAIPGKLSIDLLEKTATRILGTSHIRKVLQCEMVQEKCQNGKACGRRQQQ